MNLQYSLINSKDNLKPHKDSILELFSACFGKELDPSVWDWAYLDNPMGNPIVSLCHADGKLVGHYAVIPFDLAYEGEKLPACLSMTTMVDTACRKYGLFIELAQQVYDVAQSLGYKIVFGFPNAKSTPGFRKRLAWELGEADYVANVTMKQLSGSAEFLASLADTTLIRPCIADVEFVRWRLSKPGQKYENYFPLIIKEFSNQKDIVYIDTAPDESNDNAQKYNILLDSRVDSLNAYSVFSYQFGYKVLDSQYSGLKFKKDMLLSDVF